MKASLINYRQAPRKVRLVATLIKGKTVESALETLAVATKRASSPLAVLLNSAIANAKNQGLSTDSLIVKECIVNSGMTLKRHMAGARGTAFPLKKHASHVHITLAVKEPKKKLKASKSKAVVKEA